MFLAVDLGEELQVDPAVLGRADLFQQRGSARQLARVVVEAAVATAEIPRQAWRALRVDLVEVLVQIRTRGRAPRPRAGPTLADFLYRAMGDSGVVGVLADQLPVALELRPLDPGGQADSALRGRL